jgi:lipoprotein-anchoring transpeptidase ErfK/SrfK
VRIRGRTGRALDERPVRRKVLRELATPTPRRLVTGRLRTVQPQVTSDELGGSTFISIDRGSFTLRLFKGTRLARRYSVAVGAAGYATPAGLHRVISKEVNPSWRAPNKPWAGELAGQTIPYGDPRNPLKARFIAIGDGIGIHGTAQEDSIGTRASHGCIRMRVAEVKRLYPLVPVGTPVLVR